MEWQRSSGWSKDRRHIGPGIESEGTTSGISSLEEEGKEGRCAPVVQDGGSFSGGYQFLAAAGFFTHWTRTRCIEDVLAPCSVHIVPRLPKSIHHVRMYSTLTVQDEYGLTGYICGQWQLKTGSNGLVMRKRSYRGICTVPARQMHGRCTAPHFVRLALTLARASIRPLIPLGGHGRAVWDLTPPGRGGLHRQLCRQGARLAGGFDTSDCTTYCTS